MQLILMRHGESPSNREGRMQGQGVTPCQASGADDDLTDQGRYQVACLGRWLRQQPAPTALYCSPLRRAQSSLALLREHCPSAAAPLSLEPNLQELDQGIFSGLTWPEAQARYPQLCEQLEQTPSWLPVPQAESPQQARHRAGQLLNSLLQRHGTADRLWLMTHAGFLAHLVSEILGSDRTWGLEIAPTGLFDFQLDTTYLNQQDENRFNPTIWRINHFNSTAHLSI